jgi:hypothetical protein
MLACSYRSFGGAPPVPWYERSSFWGIVGVFLYFAGIGVGMTPQLPERLCLIAALPCAIIAAWIAINGLTTRRMSRIVGRIVTTILIGLMLFRTDCSLAKRREHNATAWGYWQGYIHRSGDPRDGASQAGKQFEALVRLECQLRLNGYKSEANDLGLALRQNLDGIIKPLSDAGVALGLLPTEYRG